MQFPQWLVEVELVYYQNGHYELTTYDSYGIYQARLLGATARSTIKTGLKETNSIAVIASGKQIDLYVIVILSSGKSCARYAIPSPFASAFAVCSFSGAKSHALDRHRN